MAVVTYVIISRLHSPLIFSSHSFFNKPLFQPGFCCLLPFPFIKGQTSFWLLGWISVGTQSVYKLLSKIFWWLRCEDTALLRGFFTQVNFQVQHFGVVKSERLSAHSITNRFINSVVCSWIDVSGAVFDITYIRVLVQCPEIFLTCDFSTSHFKLTLLFK